MEDFVPYELAVKLEQKGFKQGYNIFGYRPIFSDETTIRFISDIGAYYNEYFGENIAAPTISQVLKWLRKEKKIHIVCPFYKDKGFYYYVQRIGNAARIVSSFDDSDTCFDTSELAAIAGIEYVIDNLI